jgi:leader peptidase (prepilin peptidase)/N-methyltransferase
VTPLPPLLELAALTAVALAVGSFLSVLVTRLPEGRGVVRGRSACPHCARPLAVRDLVPLVSYLVARGRCRHCGRALSAVYPGLELGALAIAFWAIAVVPGWLAWATAGLGWALLALAVIDVRHMLLPDALTLPLIPAGLLLAGLGDPGRILDHAIGAAAGFLLVVLLRLAYRALRGREGMGLGDAKLLAGAGAWLSWQGLPSVVLLGAAGGLCWALLQALRSGRLDRRAPLPFGPFLAAAWWLVWLYGPLVPGGVPGGMEEGGFAWGFFHSPQ